MKGTDFPTAEAQSRAPYVGRLAPSPTGLLHAGHAQTFQVAVWRAQAHQRELERELGLGPRLGPAAASKRKRAHEEADAGAEAGVEESSTAVDHGYSSRVLLRIEDLDAQRCKEHFTQSMLEDLRWLGIGWTHGYRAADSATAVTVAASAAASTSTYTAAAIAEPGAVEQQLAPHCQSRRAHLYAAALRLLRRHGFVYPSPHSRKAAHQARKAEEEQVAASSSSLSAIASANASAEGAIAVSAASAPNEGDCEALFPTSLRPAPVSPLSQASSEPLPDEGEVNWRFLVDGAAAPVCFQDNCLGLQTFRPQVDFGDFVVFTKAGYAAYELAVVVDDALQGVTEVVRGADLLLSTARQLLLLRALATCVQRDMAAGNTNTCPELPLQALQSEPQYFHCPLVRDGAGVRLAKRTGAETLRAMREAGLTAAEVRRRFFDPALAERFQHELDK